MTTADVWIEEYKAKNRYLKRKRNEAEGDAGWKDRDDRTVTVSALLLDPLPQNPHLVFASKSQSLR